MTTVRAALAEAIAAEVNPTWPQVQVYAHPEDVTQLPALVLVPDDMWAEPGTFGGGGQVVRWQFQLTIAGHRAAVESTMEMIEALRPLVVQGIGTLGGRWLNLTKPDTLELAGAQALASFMGIELLTERQT